MEKEWDVTDNRISKNKIVKVVGAEEHILYEVSAEIVSVLSGEPIFQRLFRSIECFEQRLYESLSHTRSEAERTKSALVLLKDLWYTQTDSGPYLVPNLLATFEYERLFHRRYRDHSVHQLRVLLLGLYLYCRNRTIREAVRREVKEFASEASSGNQELDDAFSKAWLITAIYHDQGYVFQLSAGKESDPHLDKVYAQFNSFFEAPLSKHLLETFGVRLPAAREKRARVGLRLPQAFFAESIDHFLLEPDGQANVLEDIEQLVNSCKLGPAGKSLATYFEMSRNETPEPDSTPHYDHGVVSAIILLRSHRELERYVNDLASVEENGRLSTYIPSEDIRQAIVILGDALKKSAQLIRHSAAAIAVHNIDKTIWPSRIYAGPRYNLTLESFEISLVNNPLAWLLCFSDNLQDWDRPRFALPEDVDDHIRIDQHMLLSANDDEIGVRFYPASDREDSVEHSCFSEMKRILCTCLPEQEVTCLLSENARITIPDELSPELIDQAKAGKRVQLRHRYDLLENKWQAYLSTISTEPQEDSTEVEQRSRQLRHFTVFLKWCEEERYEYLKPAPSKELEELYSKIKAEVHNLNYVVIGSVLEDRKIISRLGAGGYGTVYKVQRQNSTAAPFEALKIFHTSNFNDPELVDRFKRGYHSMTTLQHPQITKVSSDMRIPRGYFMEFIEGENLARFMDERSLRICISTAQDRLQLMVDVCQILEYAHQEGVRHRDIKPENIIMRWSDPKGKYEPVLTDFDLAWYVQAVALTISGAELVGSYWYAAPEQKKPKEDTNIVHLPTVDIFSLGRLLYFVFTEQAPEEDLDLGERINKMVSDRFNEVAARSFPFELASIYRKATRVIPKDRYQSVKDLRIALEELLRLIGAMAGTFEERVFLHELGLRLNNRDQYERDAQLAEDGKLCIRLMEGEITVASVHPDRGRPYLEVKAAISHSSLARLQQRTYRKARERLNSSIDKWVKQKAFDIYNAHRGTSDDIYSYTFNIRMPDLNLANLEDFYTAFDSLKDLFCRT